MTSLSRREFLKTSIAATTAATAGLPVTQAALAQAKAAESEWKWGRGLCRFCGTGCGELIATHNGKIVAIKGDPDAPVNRGLNCIKGYYNGRILYGEDRLTKPLMRMKDGKFDKGGDFVPVSWETAMDEMERQFKRVYKEKGPSGVAMLTSGQSLIQEGYVAAKLMKAGFRSNNIDPNARLCMASAVVAFIQTFGIDEPANVYDDIELADTMILWGANMAEAHPVLWSRVTDRRLSSKSCKVINVTTYRNMSSDIADLEVIMKPNSDLAILNYILREIIERKAVNTDFVNKHCVFATGPYDIGYGMRPTDKFAFPAEKDVLMEQKVHTLDKYEAIGQRRKEGEKVEQKNAATAGAHWQITFEEFKRGVAPYTLDFVAEVAKGDPDESMEQFKTKLKQLADAYIEKSGATLMSFWTMGVNQHVRGVWVNEQIYATHLLLGKHGLPGCGAFSLTGQPSACGTAREVGTFAHRLPADMLVDNPKHRERTAKLWNLPTNTLNPKIGTPLMNALRGLEDGSVGFVWTQTVNLFQSAPNSNHWLKAARKPENFVVVADAYPSYSGKVADLILPAAMIYEKWGGYGNAERRTQLWRQQVDAPGEARSDVWMMLEFSKRFKLKDVWSEQALPGLAAGEGYLENKLPSVLDDAKKMGYTEESTLYDVLFATPANKKVAWPDPIAQGTNNSTVKQLGDGWFVEKALFEEYRQFTVGHQHDLAAFDAYYDDKIRGLRWPVVDGKETKWRFTEGSDPYVKTGEGFNFYGPLMKAIPTGNLDGVTDKTPKPLAGKAKIFFRPYAAYPEQVDKNYDLLLCTGRILEHWHTGTMTRRVPQLHRAAPTAVLYMHETDAKARGLKDKDVAWVESRRGKIKMVLDTRSNRSRMPRGMLFGAFFDEAVQINQLVIDAADPISAEPDFKKSAVKVYKV